MGMPWFRMYSEFLTDPIVRMLSFEDQRHFVAALCMKASGVTDKRYVTPEVQRRVYASLLGLNEENGEDGKNALDAANQRLKKVGLVDENWNPTNWSKRQFVSDHADPTAADRMRRYRNKRNDTVTRSNVTALDTEQIQNRTDTEQKEIPPSPQGGIDGLDPIAWEAWNGYKRYSPKYAPIAQRALAKFGTRQMEAVEHSIGMKYQGLYLPKNEPKGKSEWR